MSTFSQSTYIARRELLMKRVSNGLILLLGNEEVGINFDHNWYPYRQDSTFLYYFGISKPGLCAILDANSGETIIYGKEQSIEDIVWTGEIPTIKELAQSAGVDTTSSNATLASHLNHAIERGRQVHFLPPYRSANILKLQKYLGIIPYQVKQGVSVELIKAVVEQRNIKSEEEIEQLHQAATISSRMHRLGMRLARPGKTEREIAAEMEKLAKTEGGALAFPSIVTTHGQILHNHSYDNTLKEGDMLLLDAGAEIASGYCGDLSSTIPVSDEFTAQQQAIYEVVLASHNESIEMLKPSVYFMEVYKHSCRVIFEGLKSLGLTKGDTQEAVEAGAHTLFFQCGLGHMMGLDVHDMEDLGEEYVGYTSSFKKRMDFGYKSLRLGKQLEEGNVVTIEPGVYFIPQLIDQWRTENKFSEFINFNEVEKYKSFGGIRNEEDFVIRSNSYELLGEKKPKSIEDIREEKALIAD